jgi:hypothetical protein
MFDFAWLRMGETLDSLLDGYPERCSVWSLNFGVRCWVLGVGCSQPVRLVSSQWSCSESVALRLWAEIINAPPTTLGHEGQLFLPRAATVAIIRLLQTPPE